MSDFLSKFSEKNYEDTIAQKKLDPKKDNKNKKDQEKPRSIQRQEHIEETQIDPSYRKQKRLKIILSVVLISLTLILSTLAFVWMNQVKVPDYVNQNIGELESWAARNDITLDVEEVFSLDVHDQVIISMDPLPLSTISKGSILTVVVSKGADPDETVTLPDFSTWNEVDINTFISENQLNNLRINYENSDTVEAGAFIRIKFNDKSGTLENYQRKDYAIITLSTGPEVFEKNIKVLDWTTLHKLATEVETWATKEGVKLVIKQAYSQLPINSVISQSISADTLIAKNDTLTITVSKGVSVLVPDFKSMNMTDAETEITALNLLENVDVSLIKMYNDTNIYGTYIWQDVNAGTKIESSLDKKFEMRVYYGLGKPFIESKVGSLESSLTSYFYTLNLNSANLTYSVTYSNCGSGYDRGEICSMSKFNEYVSVGTHIDIVVHQ